MNDNQPYIVTYPKGTTALRSNTWLYLHCNHTNDTIESVRIVPLDENNQCAVSLYTRLGWQAVRIFSDLHSALRFITTRVFNLAFLHWYPPTNAPTPGIYQIVGSRIHRISELNEERIDYDQEFTLLGRTRQNHRPNVSGSQDQPA